MQQFSMYGITDESGSTNGILFSTGYTNCGKLSCNNTQLCGHAGQVNCEIRGELVVHVLCSDDAYHWDPNRLSWPPSGHPGSQSQAHCLQMGQVLQGIHRQVRTHKAPSLQKTKLVHVHGTFERLKGFVAR